MSKVVRLTESDLVRIVKRVINEKDNQINEIGLGDVVDAGLKAGKMVGLDSDWAYLTQSIPGLNLVKPTYDIVNAFRTMQKQTFEQNMESIREFMSGFKGATIAVALDTMAIGEVLNPSFWGLYTVYDLWLWSKKGVLNMFNLIMDVICLATAGAATAFVKGFKSVMAPFAKAGTSKFISAMAKKAPKLFQYLSKIIKGSSSILSKSSAQMAKGIQILSKKLPFLLKGLTSMKSGLGVLKGFLHEIEVAISHEVAHFAKHTVQHYGQHQVAHAVVGNVVGHGGNHGGGHASTSHAKPTVAKTK